MWQYARTDLRRRTPFLALQHDRLMTNIRDMAQQVESRGGRSTPHLKTHKCMDIAQIQLANGAAMATVATIDEANCAFDSGFESILVAYPPVAGWRLDALVGLVNRGSVAVTCSNPQQVELLAGTGAPFDIYWEIDSGTSRLGTSPGADTRLAVRQSPFGPLTPLRGLMTFAGQAYSAIGESEMSLVREQQDRAISDSVDSLLIDGVDVARRSVGVTPLAPIESGQANEYRYGNYVFYDATQVALGGPGLDQCALAVITTVIDVPNETRLVVDAGAKSIPSEQMTTATRGFGVVLDHPEITLAKLFEEHGLCVADSPHGLRVGDRLAIVPNHACTTVNLYSQYSVFDESGRNETWKISARRL